MNRGGRRAPRPAAVATPGDGWRRGAVAISPVLIGVVPFGFVAGVAGVENGATVVDTVAFSLLAFAGASQIAALDLLGAGAPVAVVIGTAIMINLRFAMYSASLAPYLADEPIRRRLLGAYLLTDHAYAIALTRYAQYPPPRSRGAYYLGAAVAFWVTWQLATVVGAVLGTGVPEQIPLGFAVPLSFLALLVPTLVDRPSVLAAVVAGTVATVGHGAPANLGMLVGALAGAAAGAAAGRRHRKRSPRR
ncbi:MAG: AzlC family ABC transporter permease [Actinomycetota bacterium]|nr:AzlC family ABC transporter permease [Actinomycetota bacterium]